MLRERHQMITVGIILAALILLFAARASTFWLAIVALIILFNMQGCASTDPNRAYRIADEYNMCVAEFQRRGLTWVTIKRHPNHKMTTVDRAHEMMLNGCSVGY
jgi:p-aminobenzoyl-glutamate transporter AbgT